MPNPMLEGKPPYPLLIIISGPSGVGKDTVLMRMRELGFPFHFVVNMNSRPPRPGEIDGIDYHFVSAARFEQLIAADEMLEWAQVYGQYKGVPKSEIRSALESGRDVIIRMNVAGALTIKRIIAAAVLIYIAPASLEELRHRLSLRHTESAEEREVRLAQYVHEQEQIQYFDYVVINHENQLDATASAIRAIITAEKHRVFPHHLSL